MNQERRQRRRWFWNLTRSIHRRVVFFLVLAVGLGMMGGTALTIGGEGHTAWLCTGLALVAATWPLAWVATFRIAHPMSQLAKAAGQLRDGRLAGRSELPSGDDEVGEVGEALRSMADRLAEQLEDQRALLASVSHELRSPLARVRILVELGREGRGPPSMHDDLQEEIDGMDALVGDLLATARIDFSALNPVPLDPADVAARAMEIARVDASRLTLSGHGIVRADPTLLGRALSGLLSNAQRHGGGTARLTVERQATQVRFLVDDDGPGFGPGEEESAFQPFWRRPGESTKGVGLGLALVRRIARSHGGDAGAQNREEGGARVWLSLPVAEP